jgi:predicted nucleic acid-binding protein
LQNRIGLEAVETFVNELLPVAETYAIDAELHAQAIAALLAARRRKLSLVDCSSFLLLRSLGAKAAFAFDRHFREQGFALPTA